MRRERPPISDLASLGDTDVVSVSQVADYLDMDRRAVRALVKAGVFVIKATGTREMLLIAASLKQFVAAYYGEPIDVSRETVATLSDGERA